MSQIKVQKQKFWLDLKEELKGNAKVEKDSADIPGKVQGVKLRPMVPIFAGRTSLCR